MSNLTCEHLFIFNESIIKIIKLRKLLKQGHELIISAVALYGFMILRIEGMTLSDESVELVNAPLTKGFCRWVLIDKSTISIVNELHKATRHHFFVQIMIGQQRYLISIQLSHIVAVETAIDSL